jgi:hypothetical protein
MLHAIFRGEAGRRHEVDFGDVYRFVSRFMPAKRRSRFSSRRFRDAPGGASAVRASQRSPPPFQRSHRRSGATRHKSSSRIFGVTSDVVTGTDPQARPLSRPSESSGWHADCRDPRGLSTIRRADRPAKTPPCPSKKGLRNRWNDASTHSRWLRLTGPGPPKRCGSGCDHGRTGKRGVPNR